MQHAFLMTILLSRDWFAADKVPPATHNEQLTGASIIIN